MHRSRVSAYSSIPAKCPERRPRSLSAYRMANSSAMVASLIKWRSPARVLGSSLCGGSFVHSQFAFNRSRGAQAPSIAISSNGASSRLVTVNLQTV